MRILQWLFPLSGAVLLALSGCGKKADVKSQISELEKSFQDTSLAAPAASESALGGRSPDRSSDAKAYVNLALSAVQSNDYAGGVIALQAAQRMPRVTAEQLMAVQGAMQAITADLVARADRGDAKAKAQLAAIERTRSQ